jgi:hypothetical protein
MKRRKKDVEKRAEKCNKTIIHAVFGQSPAQWNNKSKIESTTASADLL